MRKSSRTIIFMVLLCSTSVVAQKSSYAGEERCTIKSLSEKEIEQYLSGAGMGLAKAAELNHYPGPTHVLELADTLELTKAQKSTIEKIVKEMKSTAIHFGKEIVEKEKLLNNAFASNAISIERLEKLTNEIGTLQGTLRFTHLQAHIATKEILSKHQVMLYDVLRGYTTGTEHNH